MSTEIYLDHVKDRLRTAGFDWRDGSQMEGPGLLAAASKSGFELTKLGISEDFFVFGQFDNADINALRDFSARVFDYAVENKKSWLPRGLFSGVFVYAVAIVHSIDDEAARSIRQIMPPKHWSAAEIPVVLNLSNGELIFFEKTSAWGAAYYKGFRSKIKQFLTPPGLPRLSSRSGWR